MEISQEELGERSGLHRTYISDVERGTRNVTLASIEKLAAALNVSVPSLLSYPRKRALADAGGTPFSEDELVDILLVEDHRDDADLAMHALRNASITNPIHIAQDGKEALDFLFATGPFAHRLRAKRPQLVLLDLRLPKIDGLEVLRRIKSDPRTRDIAVVVLTSSNRSPDIIASKQLGSEGYIVKPVDFQSLSAITNLLSLRWALLKSAPASRP